MTAATPTPKHAGTDKPGAMVGIDSDDDVRVLAGRGGLIPSCVTVITAAPLLPPTVAPGAVASSVTVTTAPGLPPPPQVLPFSQQPVPRQE